MVDIDELKRAVVHELGCNTNLKYFYEPPGRVGGMGLGWGRGGGVEGRGGGWIQGAAGKTVQAWGGGGFMGGIRGVRGS